MEETVKYEICSRVSNVDKQRHHHHEGYKKIQLWIGSCVILGNILIGFMVGWSAPITRKLQDIELTPLPYVLTEEEVSWVTSVLSVGAIVGSNVCGHISNVIGRKPCHILGGSLIFVGFAVVTGAVNFGSILAGRFIIGLGGGSIAVNNLVYLSEIASPNIRGFLLAFTGVMHTVGSLLVYSVGPFISYYAVGGIVLVLSTVFIAGCFTIPETPMFYIIKGKKCEAKAILCKLGRSNDLLTFVEDNVEPLVKQHNKSVECHIQHKAAAETDNEKVNILKFNKKDEWKWLELFRMKSNRKALVITVFLSIIQQSGGSCVIFFYVTTIFANAGSSIKPDIATIMLGLTEVFGASFAPLLVEKIGRRVLMLISTFGCCVCLAGMSIHFYLELIDHPSITFIGWLPLVLLILNIFFYNAGLAIVPGTLAGEMFSTNVRSIGSSLAVTIGLAFAFISGVSYGYLVVILGSHGLFGIYSAANGLGFLFSVFFVQETKGKSLKEIENMLNN